MGDEQQEIEKVKANSDYRDWTVEEICIMSQSSMEAEGGEEMEVDEVEEEIEVEQMVEEQIEEAEETDEEEIEEEDLYETIKYLLMAIQAVVHVLKEFIITFGQPIERPLNRRLITIKGYNYIHKLCIIIREKTLLRGTRFICIEEMLATFLLIVGHNSRYCLLHNTFGRSHWIVSRNFNNVLKALNTIAHEMMAKHGLDCIGAIDGTHIPPSVSRCEVSSYRNRKGVISQNVLAASLDTWRDAHNDNNVNGG
ncbi:nuclease HARBI1-like [Pyrus ussuriensis x Pyrus communis]|uniref:Nuclease HARBI1-like n=1 Tax=Pyrus ussuriensis x Pyrus communis TaxID=2448454 RepID=A0A5N5GBW1_9ROSA|nr:nuclease HARBI1-like [Pyrus ussuriensis x Pyrus communis]